MKKILIICIGIISVAQAQLKKAAPKTAAPVFKNSIDSFSYAIGLEAASFYKSQGVPGINSALMKRAIDDVYGKKTLLLTPEQSTMTIQRKMQGYMMEKQKISNSQAAVVKAEGKKFLADNKKRPGVVELPSGLQYEVIKQGNGPIPTATDTIKIHYSGTLINGQKFDASYDRGEPIVYPVTGFIQGWVQALQLMPVGSKWKLYIPSDLGYGDRGAGAAIPGGATLIFEMELLDIVNKK
jgi:FKBP-type peptidyl-prolyl cis-trans isomerase FklB